MSEPLQERVAVVGLGYVGLPLALAFGRRTSVIAFDSDTARVETLARGEDWTGQVPPDQFRDVDIQFTADAWRLKEATFHIVAVPTPVDKSNRPDLGALAEACRILGSNIRPGCVIVFESTVYPGVTDDICVPLLEKYADLRCDRDFFVGYSPERINPGDTEHVLETVPKVVSARDPETLQRVSRTYAVVCKGGVVQAASVKVAEAAKVIENTQRDINIALMNELAMIFHRLDIDIHDVLDVAGTKWNFLKFYPGLVGGHCIGVDPYYLAHKAQEVGFQPQVILAGRRTNDGMGKFVAEAVIKQLIRARKTVQGAGVAILGCTFKENVPDLRNSKVFDVIREMAEYDIAVQVVDPVARPEDLQKRLAIPPRALGELDKADAFVLAVPHDAFKDLSLDFFRDHMTDPPVLIDVRGALRSLKPADHGFFYWPL